MASWGAAQPASQGPPPSVSSNGSSGSLPDEATQKVDKEYIRSLARERALPELLKDELMLQKLRIPAASLRAHLQNEDNHGMAGIGGVMKMLYTAPPPRPPPLQQSFVPQRAPPPPPSTPPPPPQQQQSFVPQRATQQQQPLSSPPPAPSAPPAEEPPSSRHSIRDALNEQRIFLSTYAPGSYRIKCPKCAGGSKGETSFGITIDDDSKSAVWQCFRSTCGFAGSAHVDKPPSKVNSSGFFVSSTARKRKEEPPVRPENKLEPLTPEMLAFFAERGISEATLRRAGVASEVVYDPGERKEARVIAFPYYRDGVLVNVKYRTLDKRFWQVRGAEKILYGLDDVAGQAEIIVVEGEMDKLALEEAGFKNVVSVPDGAPARVKDGALPPASEDTKYSYLWNCRAWLDQAVRIVIATDNDAPGDALAEELARRLGRERCWRVRWPLTRRDHEYVAAAERLTLAPKEEEETEKKEESPAALENGSTDADAAAASDSPSTTDSSAPSSVDERWYRKDSNEVLQRDGAALLGAFIRAAEPLPIRGLLRFHEYYEDVMKHYYLELRDGQGVSTGWPSLDQLYKVVPGELTIVTGVPNSGKSEWIDALLCNLSEMHGWTFAMCSMEKRASDHARALVEKYTGRPFFDLPYARGVRRMTSEELDAAMDWVDDRFHLIRYEDEQLPSVDWVLEIARAAVYRYGIRGLVIDPYNELDHQRPSAMSETEYVSQMLTKVKRFAQTAGVHVWFVAHPRQLREWKGQAPNLYDISGSAHFINKADNGIVVHRNRDPNAPSAAEVQILVRKVRNKSAGTIGDAVLQYERVNGRYLDVAQDGPPPPRTSERVDWRREQEAAAAAERPSGFGQGGGMFVHSDGTISSEPEDFSR